MDRERVSHAVVAIHRTARQRVTCNGLLRKAVQTYHHHASVDEEQYGRESALKATDLSVICHFYQTC